MIFFKLLILFYLVRKSYLRCSSLYGAKPCPFVPSPPGEAPPCSRPGITYCEYPEHYPKDVVLHLIEKWRYDHSTLLTSESRRELNNFFIDNHGTNQYKVPYNNIHTLTDTYGPPTSYPAATYGYNQGGHRNYSGQYPNQLNSYTQSNSKTPYVQSRYRYPQFYKNIGQPQVLNTNAWQKWNNNKYYRSRMKRSNHRRWLTDVVGNGNSTFHSRRKRQTGGGGQTLCQSRSQYIMPRAALNNKGDWMYVVNVPEVDNRYTQLVKSETCASQQCSGLCSLPNGYTSRCEQKYVQKRLVALEAGGNQLYTDVFWFPSCCICTISN